MSWLWFRAQREITCRFENNKINPIKLENIPKMQRNLIQSIKLYERLTVEACLEGSYTKALQALTLNRTVVDAKKARKVLDALIEANKGYWPELS